MLNFMLETVKNCQPFSFYRKNINANHKWRGLAVRFLQVLLFLIEAAKMPVWTTEFKNYKRQINTLLK